MVEETPRGEKRRKPTRSPGDRGARCTDDEAQAGLGPIDVQPSSRDRHRPCLHRRHDPRRLQRTRRLSAELHRLDHRRLRPQGQGRHSAWGHPGAELTLTLPSSRGLRLVRSSTLRRYGWGSRPASRSSSTRRTATHCWSRGAACRCRAALGRRRPTRWTCSWPTGSATRCASASLASSGCTPSCCGSCLVCRYRRCHRSAGLPRHVETRRLGSDTARHLCLLCLLGLVQQALGGRERPCGSQPMRG